MIENKTYSILPIFWEENYDKEIQEVYRMLKDQEKKIFDLSWYQDNPGGVMDYVEEQVSKGNVFVAKCDDDICGMFILENPREYNGRILFCDIHCAIRKKYWGQEARNICNTFKNFLKYSNINRLIANVPQCGYGVIKLLKNIGFKHEGTVKRVLVFKDKNGNEKLYDSLIYALDLED